MERRISTNSSNKQEDGRHTHILEESDCMTINSFLKNVAAEEIGKGYKPATVWENMRGVHNHHLTDKQRNLAGGKFMKREDVVNAGRSYWKANPDQKNVTPVRKGNVDVQIQEVKTKADSLGK